MKVGICGLGLIGGSMAKAYRACGHEVLGADTDEAVLGYAAIADIISGRLTDDSIGECDLIFIALYPEAAVEYLRKIAPLVNKEALVMDLCGTKRRVCEAGFSLAREYGFTFVGGHPMAGKQYSGIKYATETLFKGAPMVIVPSVYDDIALMDRIKNMLSSARLGRLSVTTAEKHDEVIAFTSQLAHVVSNAYVKSPTAEAHRGFSAGSYKDLTRVAWLNENMWTELFLENREHLLFELDHLIAALSEYRDAINTEDREELRTLLRQGREAKEKIDG